MLKYIFIIGPLQIQFMARFHFLHNQKITMKYITVFRILFLFFKVFDLGKLFFKTELLKQMNVKTDKSLNFEHYYKSMLIYKNGTTGCSLFSEICLSVCLFTGWIESTLDLRLYVPTKLTYIRTPLYIMLSRHIKSQPCEGKRLS